MPSLIQVEADAIAREARLVGLHQRSVPNLRDVERRRTQLWLVSAVILCAVSLISVVMSWNTQLNEGIVSPAVFRAATIGVAIAFTVYAAEKEIHLRRLTHLLIEQEVKNIALESRIDELTALSAASRAANAVLEPSQVLDVILNGAIGVLGGTNGSIMLLEGDYLHTAAQTGNPAAAGASVRVGDSIAGQVAKSRKPMIIDGDAAAHRLRGHEPRDSPVTSAVSVPLIHRGEVLGVLNINTSGDRQFREYDLAVAELFADAASVAIANARLFDAERSHVADLLERDRRRQAFVGSVSHEFNNPLTSLRGAVSLFKRVSMNEEDREVLGVLDRQIDRLAELVDELKAGAHGERAVSEHVRAVDLAGLLRVVAEDSELAGRPIRVSGIRRVVVLADPNALRRVLDNLIDNAFKYGTPPVDVSVRHQGPSVLLRVFDRGSGVPPEDQARVFERHYRRPQDMHRPGQGLGLAIVRGIVDSMHGQVWIDAPGDGQGMAVVVSLPASEGTE